LFIKEVGNKIFMNHNKLTSIFNEPAQITRWHDKEPTGAQGWIVIDTLNNGVASGGLFMHSEATFLEVAALAKTMSYKNALQTPIIGGAKGGIQFNHNHPEAKNVLKRFLADHRHQIEKFWSTGSDLNTNNDFIQHTIMQALNLSSGFVSVGKMLSKFYDIPDQSRFFLDRISQPVPPYFTLAGCATGYSINTCVSYFCRPDARVIIQGWGNVGRSAAYFLQKYSKCKIVGIIEKDFFIYHEDGLDINDLLNDVNLKEEINCALPQIGAKRYFIMRRPSRKNDEDFLIFCLSKISADIFCPCATRYAITNSVAETLLKHTFIKNPHKSWVISGANNVFLNEMVIMKLEQSKVNVLPEWISNSGNSLVYNEVLKKESFSSLVEESLSNVKNSIINFLDEALAHIIARKSNYQQYHDLIESKFNNIHST